MCSFVTMRNLKHSGLTPAGYECVESMLGESEQGSVYA